jgi:uncharacterized membrane protein
MKIFQYTYLIISILLLSTITSFAYLDGGALTYVIQIVAGGVIAGGTAITLYWHKLKKKVRGNIKKKNDE